MTRPGERLVRAVLQHLPVRGQIVGTRCTSPGDNRHEFDNLILMSYQFERAEPAGKLRAERIPVAGDDVPSVVTAP